MQGIEIRPIAPDDYAQVAFIERECFPDPWSEMAVRQTAESEHSVLLVAEVDGQVIAYGGMLVMFEDAEMLNVAVLKKFRGQGIGRAIMQGLISEAITAGAERMLLEVRRSNTGAIVLYEKLGFVPISERKGYYADGEDAIIYQINL